MIKQFLKFGIIGVSNSFVNFIVYNIALLGFKNLDWFSNFDYLAAQFISFTISVFWSFCMNRKFVFNSEAERAIPWYKVLFKMYVAYSFTGIGLNSILSIIWVQVFGLPKEIISILNDVIGFPINFLLNKFWSFRNKERRIMGSKKDMQ